MIIDVSKIYEKNIGVKYETLQCPDFLKDFSKKERDMWHFSYLLIRDWWPKTEFETDSLQNDEKFVSYHKWFLYFIRDDKSFSIKEWADYMKKMA